MGWINKTIYHNATCLKCGAIAKEMIRIGCIVMCNKCCTEEFKHPFPIESGTKDYEVYRKWVDKYKAGVDL